MFRRWTLIPLVSMALIAPSTAGGAAEVASSDAFAGSPNMTAVANLKHRARTLEGAQVGGGSDIEFAAIEVPVTAPDGTTVMEKRDFALAGSYSSGLQIIDITDPQNPTTAAVYDCVIQQGDVQVFEREGRTFAAYASDNGYGSQNVNSQCYREARDLGLRPSGTTNFGIFIVDVTNPYAPKTVSFLAESRGSHNLTVAPGGNYVYNSNSDLGAGNPQIEVWDISNFAAPRSVFTLNTTTGLSAHDITFNDAGNRAYAAAITHTLVIDTTNLAQPAIIGRIVDPAINIHHQSDPITMKDATTGLERTFLVVTDELAGAGGNAACPGGGLHIFDITGPLEQAPVKVGAFFSPVTRPATDNLTCTSHVLRMYPKEQIMTIAWYEAGVRVVDISGLIGVSAGVSEEVGNVGAGMKEIGYFYHSDADTWSAKTNRIEEDGSFYLYGNDGNRGLDVYRFNASAPASSNPGTWLSPAESLARARAMGVQDDALTGPRCLYLGGLKVA